MTTKDYSDPKTVQEIIEQCRRLQEEFNSEIDLDYLEKALEILEKTIENTSKDDPNREKYIYERNRLHNRYPDLEKWLSGPRYDYQLDIKYEYQVDNEEQEELNRNILLKCPNQTNKEKESETQAFLEEHREIFDGQFDYALVGFEGSRDYQVWRRHTDHRQDWVSIFLSDCDYPKIVPTDESFEIVNAPALDGDSVVYLPERPDFSDNYDRDEKSEEKEPERNFLIPFYPKDAIEDSDPPIMIFEFSNTLIQNLTKIRKLINSDEVNALDIKSFHFLVNKVYLPEELNADSYEYSYWFTEWLDDNRPKYKNTPMPIIQIRNLDLGEYQKFDGDRSEKLFAEISISREGHLDDVGWIEDGAFIEINLMYNFNIWEDVYDYEYWDYNPNAYQIMDKQTLDGFLGNFIDPQ